MLFGAVFMLLPVGCPIDGAVELGAPEKIVPVLVVDGPIPAKILFCWLLGWLVDGWLALFVLFACHPKGLPTFPNPLNEDGEAICFLKVILKL